MTEVSLKSSSTEYVRGPLYSGQKSIKLSCINFK